MIKIYLSSILGGERMTQIDLARRTGIRPATINALYHETIDRINLEYLSRICKALECDVEDLLQHIPDEEYYKNRPRKRVVKRSFNGA